MEMFLHGEWGEGAAGCRQVLLISYTFMCTDH